MRREKGAQEPIRLGSLQGIDPALHDVTVWIKHLGPEHVRVWGMEYAALQRRELRRIVVERQGLTPEVAPEVFATTEPSAELLAIARDLDESGKKVEALQVLRAAQALSRPSVMTAEGYKEFLDLSEKVLTACVARVDGHLAGETPQEMAAELRRLGAAEMLFQSAMEVQGLTKAQEFPVADLGHAPVAAPGQEEPATKNLTARQ